MNFSKEDWARAFSEKRMSTLPKEETAEPAVSPAPTEERMPLKEQTPEKKSSETPPAVLSQEKAANAAGGTARTAARVTASADTIMAEVPDENPVAPSDEGKQESDLPVPTSLFEPVLRKARRKHRETAAVTAQSAAEKSRQRETLPSSAVPAGERRPDGRDVAGKAKTGAIAAEKASSALPVLPLSPVDEVFLEQTEQTAVRDSTGIASFPTVPETEKNPKKAEKKFGANDVSDGAPDTKAESGTSSVMSAFEWVEAAVFALIAIALVFAFLLRTVGVDGDSMNNTLIDQDKLILSSYPYIPQRGDIVVINRTDEEPLIKRVIAVAGDTLDIDDESGEVILNGEVLDEPYLDCKTNRAAFSGEVVIPEGCVFVMGDNRPASHDSRYTDIGFVSISDIMGKALLRIAPLSKFGSIY